MLKTAQKVIAITDDKIELVQKFVDSFHAVQNRMNTGDLAGAMQGYKDLLSIYNDIASSALDPMHKELAYDQLTKVYQALQNPPHKSIHATTHIIAAAVLLVVFSFLVFFKPTIFGFTALTIVDANVVHDLNWAFTESGTRGVHLDAVPKSLKLNGKIDGDGFVRIYASSGNSRILLFDDNLVRIKPDGTFVEACVHTCNTGLDSNDFTLDVVVDNAAVTIYSLAYRQ